MDVTLIDHLGITWVRQRCRCCGAALWQVLGDGLGLCSQCDVTHSEPLGLLRIEHDTERVHRFHTLQYHGACAMDV